LKLLLFLYFLFVVQCSQDIGYQKAEKAYKQCTKEVISKLACSRLQECIEDAFDNYCDSYAGSLNKTSQEMIDGLKDPYFVARWNMIIKGLIAWLKETKTIDHVEIKEQSDKDLTEFCFKLVMGDKSEYIPGVGGIDPTNFDPTKFERQRDATEKEGLHQGSSSRRLRGWEDFLNDAVYPQFDIRSV